MATSTPVGPMIDSIRVHDGRGEETVRLVRVSLASILIPTFQRERIAIRIGKLTAEWDDTAYAFPIVALFKENLYCVDGQQRLAAAEHRGLADVDCLLIEGVRTHERLAAIFLLYNRDRKLLNAFEKFIGASEAKDRGTLEIGAILASFGLEASKSASINGKVPVGAVVQIHSQGGKERLIRVLAIRTQAWGDEPSKEANEGKTLLGLSRFIGRHWDKVDDDRLVAILRRHHPGYLLRKTEQARGSFQIAYADYVRELYNRGVRGKARL